MSKPDVALTNYTEKRCLPGRELVLQGNHGTYTYVHKPENRYGAVLRGTDWIGWFDTSTNESRVTFTGYCLDNLKQWEWERLLEEAESLFVQWGTVERFFALPLILCISRHNYF
ncbi:MAG TPA: hypothetical protein VJ246_04045 [Patescibacteria group bacterium]|nr:hypothetical protein [Patescibacteria group bacterium]